MQTGTAIKWGDGLFGANASMRATSHIHWAFKALFGSKGRANQFHAAKSPNEECECMSRSVHLQANMEKIRQNSLEQQPGRQLPVQPGSYSDFTDDTDKNRKRCQ
jgi:hypothetical protein